MSRKLVIVVLRNERHYKMVGSGATLCLEAIRIPDMRHLSDSIEGSQWRSATTTDDQSWCPICELAPTMLDQVMTMAKGKPKPVASDSFLGTLDELQAIHYAMLADARHQAVTQRVDTDDVERLRKVLDLLDKAQSDLIRGKINPITPTITAVGAAVAIIHDIVGWHDLHGGQETSKSPGGRIVHNRQ